MRTELSFDNEPRVLPGVQAFIDTTLRQLPLSVDDAERVAQLVMGAVKDAVETAYPPDESGVIGLSICDEGGKLDIRVRDSGLPQDIDVLEKRLQQGGEGAAWLRGSHTADVVDQMHWLAFGPKGKALQLVKWLHTMHVSDVSSAEELARTTTSVPLAPKQQYAVRRMLPDEATQVSQLMYRTYGTTYFNEDVYYPERIAALNQRGALVSIVAVGEDGRVAGHCALELNQAGRVAEIGQAAVDPAHRGRGLLDQMKAVLEKEAQTLRLAGWYADAVAVHTFTQQSDAHHGGHVCGVDLAVSPQTESFRGIANKQSQRVSCVLYFRPLTATEKRTVHVPERHQGMVADIYANMQAPFEFGGPPSSIQEHGSFAVVLRSSAAFANIRVETLGQDSVHAIRHTVRELVERSRTEVVVVELPLEDAATAEVCEELAADGLAFSGIGPHFSTRGDVLKLTYLVAPLSREPIKTFEPIAARLVEYALAEQERVRANL
ncbi:MAG TPA: GNAT family N-acetyltransferase [Lacipirellulaceae bacterium]|nr:GNAT family N-acetyltransferase [Lacipirellulaceae bacterium]